MDETAQARYVAQQILDAREAGVCLLGSRPQQRFGHHDHLAQTSTSKQDAALIAEMLSLPNDGRYPTLELAPQQRRQLHRGRLDREGGWFLAPKWDSGHWRAQH